MTEPITSQTLPVSRGPYGLYAELTPGSGAPVVLMHGFPDSTHLYDRLVPHLAGGRPIVRFDFLGWGRSDKPAGYPYTATNQAGDLAAVVGALDGRLGPARDRLGTGPPRPDTDAGPAQHLLPLDPGAAPAARDRPVLHAGHPCRRPRRRPAAARPGPAPVHLAGRAVHPGPAAAAPARPGAV